VTSLVIGEGGSGGALALASHDQLWRAPNALLELGVVARIAGAEPIMVNAPRLRRAS
jgi:acetyl-CoA carboxylase alpha subunit